MLVTILQGFLGVIKTFEYLKLIHEGKLVVQVEISRGNYLYVSNITKKNACQTDEACEWRYISK